MELKVKNRTVLGKKVKHLRKEGLIPAELYGRGAENKHLEISENDFINTYKEAGWHTIVQIVTEGVEKIPVLISDVQRHPLTRKILAVDFHQVRMDEKIETSVPIEFKGEAPAEKSGFFVVKVLNEVEVKALPTNIPHLFEVDLSRLENPGHSIHISDVKVPEGVEILTSPETVIASVTEHAEEETPAEAAPRIAPEAAPEATEHKEAPTPEGESGS